MSQAKITTDYLCKIAVSPYGSRGPIPDHPTPASRSGPCIVLHHQP